MSQPIKLSLNDLSLLIALLDAALDRDPHPPEKVLTRYFKMLHRLKILFEREYEAKQKEAGRTLASDLHKDDPILNALKKDPFRK